MVSFSELNVLRFMIRYSLKLMFGLSLSLGGVFFCSPEEVTHVLFFLNGAVFILEMVNGD